MKKVLTLLTFGLVLFVGISANAGVKADDIVELYPYDKIECLQALSTCPNTKVGDSNWDITYNGHRYHVVANNVRYASQFEDANADGLYDATEYAGAGWASFGGLIINDSDTEMIIKTNNLRGDMSSGSTPRIWWYFDEEGNGVMFEDNYVNKYDIFNEGTAEAPDWRFATEAEVTAYTDADTVLTDATTAYNEAVAARDIVVADENSTQQQIDDAEALVVSTLADKDAAQLAMDPIAATTKVDALIRMKLDDVDEDGYVLEPLGFLKWYKADADTEDGDVTNDSDIILDDPDNVVIPAGWTVLYFGYLDRDNANNKKTTAYTGTLPEAMITEGMAPAVVEYTDQPAWFSGLGSLDDDAVTEGTNIVVDYNGTYEMPTTLSAVWTNMFDDETGRAIDSDEELDFTAEIADLEGNVLQTIEYTWNAETSEYAISEQQNVIDTSVFGSGYVATFTTVTPIGEETVATADIVIGVMPPRFAGVENRYTDEDVMVDLLAGITADDGYGNDKTNTIVVNTPAGFNEYNPQPGVYEIEVEFTHHVHFDGVTPEIMVDGNTYPWDGEMNLETAINAYGGQLMVWTDTETFREVGSGWGSVMFVVGADGTVKEIYDRYTWDYTTETGTVVTDGTQFAAWQAALVIEEGGYVIAAHGSTYGTNFRDENMSYGAPVSITMPEPDFDYDIITTETYMLTVDDLTAPTVLVANENYMVEIGMYDSVDALILANIIAFDNFDEKDDLAIYVSNNDGLNLNLATTYNVEVTVEDYAGNATVVEFAVQLVEPAPTFTPEEVQALIDEAVADMLTDADVQALIDDAVADALTEADVQDLIDTALETGCGSSFSTNTLIIATIALMGGAVLFVSRKFR